MCYANQYRIHIGGTFCPLSNIHELENRLPPDDHRLVGLTALVHRASILLKYLSVGDFELGFYVHPGVSMLPEVSPCVRVFTSGNEAIARRALSAASIYCVEVFLDTRS